MRIRSAVVASGVLVALVAVLRAQDAQSPSFRAGVEAVPIDVVVLDDKGQPIRDLIAADFAIRIDGRQRRVISTQWISAGVVGTKPTTASFVPEGFVSNESTAGGRLMALVIDQPNIAFGDVRPLRDAMNGFVDRLAPSDRLAVIGLGQPSVTTPFLGDKNQIKEAIGRIPGQKPSSSAISQHDVSVSAAMAIADGDDSTLEQLAARDCGSPRLKQYSICREEIRADAVTVAEQTRQAGSLTMIGLRELLTSMKAIDGPKTLLYVSQGFFVDRGRGEELRRVNEVAELAAAARTSVYSLRMEESVDL